MMQPLLLLKQTLGSAVRSGASPANGPNVKFTSVRQFWPCCSQETGRSTGFIVTIGTSDKTEIRVRRSDGGKTETLGNSLYELLLA